MQLLLGDVAQAADFRGAARDHPLQDLEEDERPRLRAHLVGDAVRLDEEEGDALVVRAAVALRVPLLLREPRLPVRLVEAVDQVAVLRDDRDPAA